MITKKPCQNDNVIKESVVVKGDILFNKFKIKSEIYNSVKVQLSRNTLSRRAEYMTDHTERLRQDLICKCFNIQLNEPTDICVFHRYFLLFAWSSMMALVRTMCWKQYRYMGRLEVSLLETNVTIHKIVQTFIKANWCATCILDITRGNSLCWVQEVLLFFQEFYPAAVQVFRTHMIYLLK
jgi:hypothetical protein